MPAALKIILSTEEDRRLRELEVAQAVPRRTKQRATALRLNAKGWKVKEIADYHEWAESTVRQTIHRWNSGRLAGLWEVGGRGKKPRWTNEDWKALEQWRQEPRSSSARLLSQRLARERQVVLGAEQIRRILKKKVAWEKTKAKTSNSNKPRV